MIRNNAISPENAPPQTIGSSLGDASRKCVKVFKNHRNYSQPGLVTRRHLEITLQMPSAFLSNHKDNACQDLRSASRVFALKLKKIGITHRRQLSLNELATVYSKLELPQWVDKISENVKAFHQKIGMKMPDSWYEFYFENLFVDKYIPTDPTERMLLALVLQFKL